MISCIGNLGDFLGKHSKANLFFESCRHTTCNLNKTDLNTGGTSRNSEVFQKQFVFQLSSGAWF